MRFDLHRYHLTRNGKETTVSIDDILIEMLALKLGHDPDSDQARATVQAWMQDCLDKSLDPDRIHLSQWLGARIIETIASWELREKRDDWLDRKAAGRKPRSRRAQMERRPPERQSKGRAHG